MSRPSKLLRQLAWSAALATLLLAAVLGRDWALPGRAPQAQTIPPLPTPTSTHAISEPTATWTPRPTWTRVPTPLPEPSAGTPTPVVSLPTATPPPPTATHIPARVTATSGLPTRGPTLTPAQANPAPTASMLQPTPQASYSPTRPLSTEGSTATPLPTATLAPGPIPLAFEVVVAPQVAGPRDGVAFILQVANVGYEAVDGVLVKAVFPEDLWLQSVDCPRCTVDCGQCQGGQLTIHIGRLALGEQVIAPVSVEVAEDAWPGQTLRSDWTLAAPGLPVQSVLADLVLPWAELPATGGE
jgi:hypothetical protein